MERNGFMAMLQNENNKAKTFTENGAIAYASSGKFLLDFNFKLSQYRNMNVTAIQDDFAKVYYEDPLIATKFVFYVGDVRGGLGERKVFNACFGWLADNQPNVALAVLDLVPEYTRWDNLCKLVANKNVREKAFEIIKAQLLSDAKNINQHKSISLLAKWMPSINASSKETVELAKFICRGLGATPREYRKMLSRLRKYLDVVEIKMSSKEWEAIDYSTVPSQANLKYNSAFLRNDEERRREYLASLQKGETKINASVAQPHEVVRRYVGGGYWGDRVKDFDVALEEMWKALPDISVADSLVVRDGSGSMTCSAGDGKTSCLDVKTMELILRTAINNKCTQDEMPKNIIIISDMQFDGGSRYYGFNWNKTLFEQIADRYARHGYKLPKIIFWNVCARNFNTIPMQKNELGLVLCSGFSTNNMKMFMTGEIDPYKILLEQINNKRYDIINERVINLI